ncbi:MAG: WD40/YVTN/BNR-like repeat-containing protein [Gammaproteobacteria bacterium]
MPLYSSAARQFVAPVKGARQASLGAWEELGPGNVGGRTRALVIHPSEPGVLYAGSAAGGVWKTTDAGSSWKPLNDLLPNLAVNALAMDPSNTEVLYAGTGEGFNNVDAVRGAGIFKTTDGGQTWTRLDRTATPSFYFVNDIVISPIDSRRVYAATGDGIWRSLDAGDTWSRVYSRVAPENGCQELVIRTDQPSDYLFAACGKMPRQAVVIRNTDAAGEGKWTEVHTEKDMARTSLALAPSNQSIVYALASSYETGDWRSALLAVFRSTSNGDPGTWEPRVRNTGTSPLNAVLLTNAYAYFNDDCFGGARSFSNQGWYDNVIAVDPTNPDRVWAGGIDLSRSDDGGATWGLASYWWDRSAPQWAHSDHHAIVFHPSYDGGSNQILYDANDGGIFRTENAAAAVATGERAACRASNSLVLWRPLNNNYGVTQFYHGATYPGGGIYTGGTQDNGTQTGTDARGTGAWVRVADGDGGFVAVDPSDANYLYAENFRLSLRRSVNGGATFSSAIRGIAEPSANFRFLAPILIDPADPKRLWTGGQSLWRSNDRATNWSRASGPVSGGSISAIAVAAGDAGPMLVGTTTGFIHRLPDPRASDGLTEWPSARVRNANVSGIAFDPLNPGIAYATFSTFNDGSNAGHVYKTADGGTTWSPSDGSGDRAIPDVPVHAVIVDPTNPSAVYIGTDIGVFVSLDGGASWAKEDTGFPNTVVESFAIDRSGGGVTLFAFTHGRGVWRVRIGDAPVCEYAVTPESVDMPVTGGKLSLRIETSEACHWSVFSGLPWLIPPRGNGAGAADIEFTVPSNTTNRPRAADLAVANKRIRITQQ